MQEDKFLEDYKQVWQQDNEEMTRIVDIPLETLHKNIARYERRKRSRRIVWTTLSAAACLTFAVSIGLRYMTPNTPSGSPTLVAENRRAATTPIFEQASPGEQTSHKKVGATPTATSSPQLQQATLPQAPLPEVPAPQTEPAEDINPETLASPIFKDNMIETNRLVAMGETKVEGTTVETDGLVKIVSPSRNTFHEAIVEPLLALVTSDFN